MLLEGEGIKLRSLEPEDLDLLYAWENNPSIWQVSQTIVPFSKFVLHQYLENQHLDIYTSKQLRLVIETSNSTPVGLIDLFDFDPSNSRAGVGILIANEENRRQGISTIALNVLLDYVFTHLGLHQVYANIGSENTGSISLFENAGFVKVGLKKDWIKTGLTYQDEYLYQCISSSK